MSTRDRSEIPGSPSEPEGPPSFIPLRRAGPADLGLLFVIGPLLWVAGLLVVSYVVRHGEAILIALAALAAGALLALVVLVPMRIRRVRHERER